MLEEDGGGEQAEGDEGTEGGGRCVCVCVHVGDIGTGRRDQDSPLPRSGTSGVELPKQKDAYIIYRITIALLDRNLNGEY